MILPRLTTIITHKSIGEHRAAVVDADGRAWRLFSQRWDGEGEVSLGQPITGHVRSRAESQGGVFIELINGQEAFLASTNDAQLPEGALLELEVQAEAYGDKLARVRQRPSESTAVDAFERWRESLPGTKFLPIVEDAETVNHVFDDALAPSVILPTGGQLHIQTTRALTAIDIDTAGRASKGSAGARALSVNRDAAREAARQIAVRDLGGAIVIDCIAPINKSSGEQVRIAFLETFRAVSGRAVQALVPSKFGLMEVAIARGARPIGDRMLTPDGTRQPEVQFLAALRDAEREAAAAGAALFDLDLSSDLHAVYQTHKTNCDSELAARYGGRIRIERSEDGKTAVRRR